MVAAKLHLFMVYIVDRLVYWQLRHGRNGKTSRIFFILSNIAQWWSCITILEEWEQAFGTAL